MAPRAISVAVLALLVSYSFAESTEECALDDSCHAEKGGVSLLQNPSQRVRARLHEAVVEPHAEMPTLAEHKDHNRVDQEAEMQPQVPGGMPILDEHKKPQEKKENDHHDKANYAEDDDGGDRPDDLEENNESQILLAHKEGGEKGNDDIDDNEGDQQSQPQRIPENLILTGKWQSLEQLSGPISKNVQKTLALNPDLRVRWFSDESCKDYLVQHFDSELVSAFESERRGSFRGDICRAAVLSKEGGFYTDLDVEWLVPMRELVDESTTFMTVYGESDEMLNAVMAAEPGSKIMEAVLQELRKWYKPESSKQGWMGPVTLLNALKGLTHEKDGCADLDLNKHILKKSCGPHNLRLYEQRELRCNKDFVYARQHGLKSRPTPECPESRKEQSFNGLQFGLFEPGHGGKLVGWPRFAECGDWGCGGGGWTKGKGQFNMML